MGERESERKGVREGEENGECRGDRKRGRERRGERENENQKAFSTRVYNCMFKCIETSSDMFGEENLGLHFQFCPK